MLAVLDWSAERTLFISIVTWDRSSSNDPNNDPYDQPCVTRVPKIEKLGLFLFSSSSVFLSFFLCARIGGLKLCRRNQKENEVWEMNTVGNNLSCSFPKNWNKNRSMKNWVVCLSPIAQNTTICFIDTDPFVPRDFDIYRTRSPPCSASDLKYFDQNPSRYKIQLFPKY